MPNGLLRTDIPLTPEEEKYLREVWGYDRAEDVDPLTLDCLRDNAGSGYVFDAVLVQKIEARQKLSTKAGD